MENIIPYLVKVALASFVLTGIYILLFRKDTFYLLKRFYLLLAVLFPVIYPFCRFSFLSDANITGFYGIVLPEIQLMGGQGQAAEYSALPFDWLLMAFAVVSLFFVGKLLVRVISVIRLRIKGTVYSRGGYNIIDSRVGNTPFSFFNWIFIPQGEYSDQNYNIILKHELVHINEVHSFDILLSEIHCALFWWNPMAWILRKEIRINLEYLADRSVLSKGFDSKEYQYLLLQMTSSNFNIPIVNNFNVSQLKKRINMINKLKTSKLSFGKYLLLLPLVGALIAFNAEKVFSQKTAKQETVKAIEQDEPFMEVEKMPQFPGGVKAMMDFIISNLKYPESAVKDSIEGRVIAQFVVEKTGEVGSIKIQRSLSPDCDAEAIRVIKAMPEWIPGEQGGKAVPVYFTLPFLFKLEK